MKRFIIASLSLIILLLATLAIYARLHFSPAGAMYPAAEVAHIELPLRFRDSPEHDAALTRNGGNPYILEVDSEGSGALLYYGASHATDPKDPQIADISARWTALQPTVALYEGRSRGQFYGALIEPFAGLSESTLVHKLARKDNVRLYSLEPADEDEVAALLDVHAPEQVALYFFLRVYTSEAGGVANESLALDLLGKRTDIDGLRGSLTTLADVDRIWQRDFPILDNWRIVQGEYEQGYLADISDASRQVRGEHMTRILVALVEQGERVFAVVGSGHVIRQEWNFRALLDTEPAWDQPADATSVLPD